jgi:hypothetical protein
MASSCGGRVEGRRRKVWFGCLDWGASRVNGGDLGGNTLGCQEGVSWSNEWCHSYFLEFILGFPVMSFQWETMCLSTETYVVVSAVTWSTYYVYLLRDLYGCFGNHMICVLCLAEVCIGVHRAYVRSHRWVWCICVYASASYFSKTKICFPIIWYLYRAYDKFGAPTSILRTYTRGGPSPWSYWYHGVNDLGGEHIHPSKSKYLDKEPKWPAWPWTFTNRWKKTLAKMMSTGWPWSWKSD